MTSPLSSTWKTVTNWSSCVKDVAILGLITLVVVVVKGLQHRPVVKASVAKLGKLTDYKKLYVMKELDDYICGKKKNLDGEDLKAVLNLAQQRNWLVYCLCIIPGIFKKNLQVSEGPAYHLIESTRNDQEQTAIHVAALNNHGDTIHIILNSIENAELIADLLKQQDVSKNTPLHCAVWRGHFEVVQILLGWLQGIGFVQEVVRLQDAHRLTPLHLAICEKHSQIITEIIHQMESSELYELLRLKDGQGFTPLHQAIQDGCLDIFFEILKLVPRQNRYELLAMRDENGSTPVHIAAQKGSYLQISRIEELIDPLDRHALLLIRDKNGQTVKSYIED